MLFNHHLKRICEAILNDSVEDERFGDLLVEAGIKLEEKEWDVANKLLGKSQEISHAIGGREKKTIH